MLRSKSTRMSRTCGRAVARFGPPLSSLRLLRLVSSKPLTMRCRASSASLDQSAEKSRPPVAGVAAGPFQQGSSDPSAEGGTTKPFMLQLPDIDGVGLTSAKARPRLASVFDLHTLTLKPEHDGSFQELVHYVKVTRCP